MVSSSEGGSGAIGYQFMWVGILVVVVGGGDGLHASWVLVVCVGIGFFFEVFWDFSGERDERSLVKEERGKDSQLTCDLRGFFQGSAHLGQSETRRTHARTHATQRSNARNASSSPARQPRQSNPTHFYFIFLPFPPAREGSRKEKERKKGKTDRKSLRQRKTRLQRQNRRTQPTLTSPPSLNLFNPFHWLSCGRCAQALELHCR